MEKQVISEVRLKELVDEVVLKFIKENNPAIPQGQNNPVVKPQVMNQAPVDSKPKITIVKFDQETENPFTVKFSERGFSIAGTRMSFETLQWLF